MYDIFQWYSISTIDLEVSCCKIQLLLIICINIYYSKVGINNTHDPIISFVLWHCCIFHTLTESLFFFLCKNARAIVEEKRGQESWGECARQSIGRALAILIQLPEPYLFLHCERIHPGNRSKKDIFFCQQQRN